jgi:hypothetical protein
LYAFHPATKTLEPLGQLDCGVPSYRHPDALAIARNGDVLVSYETGRVFKAGFAGQDCAEIPVAPAVSGFSQFGIAFTSNTGGAAETLHASERAAWANDQKPNARLAVIDRAAGTLTPVAAFAPSVPLRANLTGSPDGRLFAYWQEPTSLGTNLAEVDKRTAELRARVYLPDVDYHASKGIVLWGGDFWIFGATELPVDGSPAIATTVVQRYVPTTGALIHEVTLSGYMLTAGTSTCAPL